MRLEHEGRVLNVVIDGADQGPPVLFIHGLSASGETFAWLPPQIAAGRRIIRMDLRGHGSSDPAPGAYTMEGYGSDAVAVLREFAGEPAVLVGHSLGACVAWWVAQNHPELVSGAVLEDPPLYKSDPAEHEANPYLAVIEEIREVAVAWQRSGAGVEEIAAELAREPIDPESPEPGRRELTTGDLVAPDHPPAQARALLALDPEAMTAAAERTTMAGIDLLAPVPVPMLVLAATEVPGFTDADERRLAASHPEAQVVRVEGSGHMIHDEIAHRPTYVELLAGFLDEHAPVSMLDG